MDRWAVFSQGVGLSWRPGTALVASRTVESAGVEESLLNVAGSSIQLLTARAKTRLL
jgi:hypothetical protein